MMEAFNLSLKAVTGFLSGHSPDLSLPALKSVTESLNLQHEQIKSVVDLALRERGLHLLGLNSMEEVKDLLQLASSAAIDGVCSASAPFLLFADLVNTKPISEAEANFQFLENTIKALKDASLFGSGRNTLLRMCNDLLRRLSKSQNTVFCGRIQLFLTSLFPLSERSGLNLMSNFNLDKEVAFNREPNEELFHSLTSTTGEGDEEDRSQYPVNADLYRRFWSLQEVLKSPSQCYTLAGWKALVDCTECVVDTFKSIRLIGGAVDGGETRWNQFTMYLTSEKLLDLQLMDPNFRQYILSQLLIIFQYLTAQVKFKNENQRLDESQLRWVQSQREAITSLLRVDLTTTAAASSESPAAPTMEPNALTVVEHILSREVHWNQWKNDGCPSFIKEPEKSTLTGRKRRMNPLQDRAGKRLYRFGNHDLDELWSACPDNLEACRDKRRLFRPPDLSVHFQDVILELDPKEKVEEQYKSVNREEWTWRALRLLSRRCTEFYASWNPPGRSIKEYLTTILTEKLETTDSNRPGVATNSRQRPSGANRAADTVSISSKSASATPAKTAGSTSATVASSSEGRDSVAAAELFSREGSRKKSRDVETPEPTVLDADEDDEDKPNSLLSDDGDNDEADEVDGDDDDAGEKGIEIDSDTDGEAADEDDDLEETEEEPSVATTVVVPSSKDRGSTKYHRRSRREAKG